MQRRVLVCDDEESLLTSLSEYLTEEGYLVDAVPDGRTCLAQVSRNPPDAIILDLRMPGMDGLTALRHLRRLDPQPPVMVLTSQSGIDAAIEAIRQGASAYLTKPFELEEVGLQLSRIIQQASLAEEVRLLRSKQREHYGKLVGSSGAMQDVFKLLKRLEHVDVPTILIQGESGTGKDLVAQAIHSSGPRKGGLFTEVDCASLPEHLVESTLFGHEKGAFTDARQLKRGLFEVARGGTIFLDEVGELTPITQAKLLRAVENRRFKRVGGVTDLPLYAAVIAATNRDLQQEVRAGRFREDLFFRLSVIPVQIPPLRQRIDDIPLLVGHFIDHFNRNLLRHMRGITADALDLLGAYRWPGNVRELKNMIERIMILEAQDDVIRLSHLPVEIRLRQLTNVGPELDPLFILPREGIALDALEKSLLIQALERTSGNQSAAARLLGISRYALRYRLEKHHLAMTSSEE